MIRLPGLILRGLLHHRRTHLPLLLGTAVAAAVLTGALLVGDSVRATLRAIAAARIGSAQAAVDAGNRSFADSLAERLARETGGRAAPVLSLRAVAVREAPGRVPATVGRVRLLGVDDRFWSFAGVPGPPLAAGEVALSRRLAADLSAAPGDEVALRFERPTLLSRDAPLSDRREPPYRRVTLRVAAVVGDDAMGRFGLAADQQAPRNAFVPLRDLQERAGEEGRANLLLAGGSDGPDGRFDEALRRAWELPDLGLSLRTVPGPGTVVLESRRVFLDAPVADAALSFPGAAGSIVWLANRLSSGDRATPYPFVTAVTAQPDPRLGRVPARMGDDRLVANRWLADTLAVRPGDRVEMSWSLPAPDGSYSEKRRAFEVAGILPMEDARAERDLVPPFPGLTDADACGDWDVGMPLDPALLADPANEAYWKRYRQTPKALVTLAAGRAMFGTRFGDLTGVRFPPGTEAAVRAHLKARIDPAAAGLFALPVRRHALAAVDRAQDVGALFLGMSGFLVAAALSLSALLFAFAAQRRSEEAGTLLALGWRPGRVLALFLGEGAAVAAAGSVAGALLGTAYTRALLSLVDALWPAAVAHAPVAFHARPVTIAAGAAASCAASLAAVCLAGRRHAALPARLLLAPGGTGPPEGTGGRGRPAAWPPLALLAAAALAIALAAWRGGTWAAPGFFAAGALLLAASLSALRALLGRLRETARPFPTVLLLGIRNAARRPSRSLAAAGVLAGGTFLLLSVSAMRPEGPTDAGRRDSGTGGFALVAETTLPVAQVPAAAGPVVPLKLRDGDDASCLNLNRAQAPRLVGVDPHEMEARGAFTGPDGAGLWALLRTPLPDRAVPGLAGDADTARWNLGVRTGRDGALLEYRDETGRPFRVRLVGALPPRKTLLQGTVLVSLSDFTRLYPSEGGWRMFLAEAPGGSAAAAREALERALDRAGPEVVPAAERLFSFLAVENAYLSMFLVLGGLGLVLGTLGLSLVVLRNVAERRVETAAMRAMGFSPRAVRRILLAEHLFLLAAGIVAGLASALVSLAPALAAPTASFPLPLLATLTGGLAAAGVLSVLAAASTAARGVPAAILKEE